MKKVFKKVLSAYNTPRIILALLIRPRKVWLGLAWYNAPVMNKLISSTYFSKIFDLGQPKPLELLIRNTDRKQSVFKILSLPLVMPIAVNHCMKKFHHFSYFWLKFRKVCYKTTCFIMYI
jgi:hypothetical protein